MPSQKIGYGHEWLQVCEENEVDRLAHGVGVQWHHQGPVRSALIPCLMHVFSITWIGRYYQILLVVLSPSCLLPDPLMKQWKKFHFIIIISYIILTVYLDQNVNAASQVCYAFRISKWLSVRKTSCQLVISVVRNFQFINSLHFIPPNEGCTVIEQ